MLTPKADLRLRLKLAQHTDDLGVQMYTSKELTHFVGREFTVKARNGHMSFQEAQEAQYDILARQILGPEPRLAYKGYQAGSVTSILRDRLGSVCNETMYAPPMVCFCDIPVDDLELHMNKYSRFGLSFEKRFLIERGATPVFYVAKGSRVTVLEDIMIRSILPGMGMLGTPGPYERTVHRSEVIDEIGKLIHETSKSLTRPELANIIGHHEFTRLEGFRQLLTVAFMCHIKCFDETVTEEAEENFYMEREWRILEHVEFRLDNVVRVFVPDESWVARVRQDVPAFRGHIMTVSPKMRCVGACCRGE